MRARAEVSVPTTLEVALDPHRSALLVHDMQVGIVGGLPGAEDFLGRVAQVLDAACSVGVAVFFDGHMTPPRELMGASQLRRAMRPQRAKSTEDVISNFSRDSPGFHILPQVEPLPSAAVLDKISMSFFAGTPLDLALRDPGLDSFAIFGAVLDVGVEPTVRHGADLGYLPVTATDACFSSADLSGDDDVRERTMSVLSGVSFSTVAGILARQ